MGRAAWPRVAGFFLAVGLVAGTAPAAQGGAAGWNLGVEALPGPLVPGAKVRTPVRLEVVVAQAAREPIQLHETPAAEALAQLGAGGLDAWVGVLPQAAGPLPDGIRRQGLAWSVSPMAILRSDTNIHTWEALRERTVCVATDGRHVGEVAAHYGAIEKYYPHETDALLALRTGQCDATVQDEDFLRELLKFPEWRKFSAQLAPYRRETLVTLVRTASTGPQQAGISRTTGPAGLRALAAKQARDIAFEVYLDQEVPDCH